MFGKNIYPMEWSPAIGDNVIFCQGCHRTWEGKNKIKEYEKKHLFVRRFGLNPKLDYTKTYTGYILYKHDK
jgi:hypothetical protein